MYTLITGGTGLIGMALTQALQKDGHQLFILTRNPALASTDATMISSLDDIPVGQPIDLVINLAGEQIVGRRWSKTRKRIIRQSRVTLTKDLVDWLGTRSTVPKTLLSGSAIGYYGNTHDDEINETHTNGDDFGANLCVDWETEALKATELGVRVCLLRTGLVLSDKGGMLGQMKLPFRFGLGARLGDGQQWMSWIHIDDHVQATRHLIANQQSSGAYNLTAPTPERNTAFTRTLAHTLGSFSIFVSPAWLIRFGLGEASELLLGGQKVLPDRLLNEGFTFRFPELNDALNNLLSK